LNIEAATVMHTVLILLNFFLRF